jgi:hypothetical protein
MIINILIIISILIIMFVLPIFGTLVHTLPMSKEHILVPLLITDLQSIENIQNVEMKYTQY